jgi:flagellin-like hook-associated protein FlgL
LISIRNDLRNGIVPSDSDVQAVKNFNLHVLDKLAEAGNLQNQMENTEELLSNQKNLLTSLASKENDVDIAEAILNLQNQDYMLQLAYKMSAMILPKSWLITYDKKNGSINGFYSE